MESCSVATYDAVLHMINLKRAAGLVYLRGAWVYGCIFTTFLKNGSNLTDRSKHETVGIVFALVKIILFILKIYIQEIAEAGTKIFEPDFSR
ncbi:MAG: hypothetical protein ACOWWO_01315 [Peptococcaceae bacterium]